jgi:hypothetical protein
MSDVTVLENVQIPYEVCCSSVHGRFSVFCFKRGLKILKIKVWSIGIFQEEKHVIIKFFSLYTQEVRNNWVLLDQ